MADPYMAAATIGSGMLSYLGGISANKANRKAAREQMQFQQRMSETAYRRAMHDMRAAGLNPILAYRQGGASSPSGASYTATNVGEAAATAAMAGANTALAARRQRQELKVMKETEKNLRQDSLKKGNETMLLDMQNSKTNEERQNLQKIGKILDADLTTAKKNARQSEIDQKMLDESPVIRAIGSVLREFGLSGNTALQQMRKK